MHGALIGRSTRGQSCWIVHLQQCSRPYPKCHCQAAGNSTGSLRCLYQYPSAGYGLISREELPAYNECTGCHIQPRHSPVSQSLRGADQARSASDMDFLQRIQGSSTWEATDVIITLLDHNKPDYQSVSKRKRKLALASLGRRLSLLTSPRQRPCCFDRTRPCWQWWRICHLYVGGAAGQWKRRDWGTPSQRIRVRVSVRLGGPSPLYKSIDDEWYVCNQ